MAPIKITLAGVEYSGPPLSLDQIEEVGKDSRMLTVVRIWLSDPEVTPKQDGPVRAFPLEITAAANAILGVSGLDQPGEAQAGPDSTKA